MSGPGDVTVDKPTVIPKGSLCPSADGQTDARHVGRMLRRSDGAECREDDQARRGERAEGRERVLF